MQWVMEQLYDVVMIHSLIRVPKDVIYHIILSYLGPCRDSPRLPLKDYLHGELMTFVWWRLQLHFNSIKRVLSVMQTEDASYTRAFQWPSSEPSARGHLQGQPEIFWNMTEECWDAYDDWSDDKRDRRPRPNWQRPTKTTWKTILRYSPLYLDSKDLSRQKYRNMCRKGIKKRHRARDSQEP